MNTTRVVFSVVVAMAFGVSCGDKATGPDPVDTPGTAIVSLTTPNADDGAVIITLQGPDLSTIQASSTAYVLYSRLATTQEARVILVGNLAAGPLFTFKIGTGQAPSAYTATVQQVAAPSDALRASTAGYEVTLAAAP